jgi:hypothetical protein
MKTLAKTVNGLALKQGTAGGQVSAGKLAAGGAGLKPLGIVLVGLGLLLGLVLLAFVLVARKKRRQQVVLPAPGSRMARTAVLLLLLLTVLWPGLVGWVVYDYLQTHRLSIAADYSKKESYALAQALKTVTELHYPRIKLSLLEVEGAPDLLEKGLVQLAIVQTDTIVGPPARSVAAIATQNLLLARSEVDKRVVYALTQVLIERGPELADAFPSTQAALRPLANQAQPPLVGVKSTPPLHSGAAAYYEQDKTSWLLKYATLNALAFLGLVLLVGWLWVWLRRTRRQQQAVKKSQELRFAGLAKPAPWSFARLLRADAPQAVRSLKVD